MYFGNQYIIVVPQRPMATKHERHAHRLNAWMISESEATATTGNLPARNPA